jgi:hypothetical protein
MEQFLWMPHLAQMIVKYFFFTLMGFDAHHTRVLLTWIIRSQQIVDDLIEWFKRLKANMLSIMSNCKPSCFIIDDAPQELRTLQ